MQDYAPLDSLPSLAIDSEIVKPSAASEVCSVLLALNPRKASGPYGLPCWLLRKYAVFLAGPICDLLCCSFNEQKFPFLWKYTDVTHLSQEKTVAIITKHVRPISFTPVISKVAEGLIYRSKSRESCSSGYSPNQFGTIPKSSTTQASHLYGAYWAKATDGNGFAVRIVTLDSNVDDTTLAEVVPKSGNRSIQCFVTEVEQWSTRNKLYLNTNKCKELIIDFTKSKHRFNSRPSIPKSSS